MEKEKSARDMLEEGIQDGTYADIRDEINPYMDDPFYRAIVQFAEDYHAYRHSIEMKNY
jgi:hypothetical protein